MNFKKVVSLSLIIISFPIAALATVWHQSENTVIISANQIVDDNTVIIADSVTVEGEINGDLIVAAGSANIKGIVHGDVIALVRDIDIEGTISGDIRLLAENAHIAGEVQGNVTAGARSLIIGDSGLINHSVSFGAGRFELKGSVKRKVSGYAGDVIVNGPVGEDVVVTLGDGRLIISSNARIGGNVNYAARDDAVVESGAEIAGVVRKVDIAASVSENAGIAATAFAKAVSAFALLVFGVLLINIFPSLASSLSSTIFTKSYSYIFIGFAYFIFIPIASLLLIFTIIGIPLALITVGLYSMLLYCAKILASIAIGRYILLKMEIQKEGLLYPLIFGILIVTIVEVIPVIGWTLKLLAVWWGFGILIVHIRKSVFSSSAQSPGIRGIYPLIK